MKKIITICIICLLALSLSITGVYAISELTKNDLKSPVVADSYGIMIDKEKADNIFEVDIFGEKRSVNYKETFNQSNMPVDKRSDTFGTFDIYVDNNQNQYIYLYNSSILCGYKKNTVYGDYLAQDKAINEDTAKETCDNFLLKAITNDQTYVFDNIYYDEREAVYIVEYVSFIDSVKTDDKCILWITANGDIGAYSMFNNNRYLKYSDIKIDIEKIDSQFKGKTSKENYKLNNNYITLDDNGKLVMVYDIYLTDQHMSQSIYIPIE